MMVDSLLDNLTPQQSQDILQQLHHHSVLGMWISGLRLTENTNVFEGLRDVYILKENEDSFEVMQDGHIFVIRKKEEMFYHAKNVV